VVFGVLKLWLLFIFIYLFCLYDRSCDWRCTAGCSLWRAWKVNCVLSADEVKMCNGERPLTGEYIARTRRHNVQPLLDEVHCFH